HEVMLRRNGDGPDAEETQMRYGAFGDLTHYIGASNTMEIVRDDWGRTTSVTDSDIGTITYSYDAFDRLRAMQDADGSVTSYDYDLLDRLVLAVHPDSQERFVYDRDLEAEAGGEPPTENSLGRIVRSERMSLTGTFTQTFRYEAKPGTGDPFDNTALLERVMLETPSESFETSYEYHPRSSRIAAHHYPPTGPTMPFGVRYCYDDVGSVTHIFNQEAAVDCATPETGPAPYWKRTSIKDGMVEDGYELGNGVEVLLDLDSNTYSLSGHSVMATNKTVQFQYEYAPGGRLEQETRSSGTGERVRGYDYEESGVLMGVTESVGGAPAEPIHTPTYNDQLQLVGSNLGTFEYEGSDP